MGHDAKNNTFRKARFGFDAGALQAVDAYRARSVWSTSWQLDEEVPRRSFTKDECDLITRYGARLDEIYRESSGSSEREGVANH